MELIDFLPLIYLSVGLTATYFIGKLLLGILGNLSVYTSGVEAMRQWHVFFSLSIGGIIIGMIEAAVVSYILIYLLIYFYNKFN